MKLKMMAHNLHNTSIVTVTKVEHNGEWKIQAAKGVHYVWTVEELFRET